MVFRIQENIPLSSYTTFKTGGNARYFAIINTIEELRTALVFAQQKRVPYFVLGKGSNVLAYDQGYEGLVISIQLQGREYLMETSATVLATFASGELFDNVIADTVDRGLWGLENLSHIPGTVGATPVQNVGAYGVEVSSLIVNVTVYDCVRDETYVLTNSQCQFAYRNSYFKKSEQKHLIIVGVTFRLSSLPNPQLEYSDLRVLQLAPGVTQRGIRAVVITIRSAKFPDWKQIGTAGSFFKNPIVTKLSIINLREQFPSLPVYDVDTEQVKVSLGFILDKVCGLKGYRQGRVQLSETQALVLIADTSATTKEIILFSTFIMNVVKEKTDILIEREVTMLE